MHTKFLSGNLKVRDLSGDCHGMVLN